MPDYTHIEEQLTTVAVSMRGYQKAGTIMARRQKKALIDLKMGTGKSVIGLSAVFCYKPPKILILCSINAFWTWKKQAERWFPGVFSEAEYVVVKGTPEKRAKLWAKPGGQVFVATYDTYRIDKALVDSLHHFDALIADEIHRVGRYKRGSNKKTGKEYSVKYKALHELVQRTPIFIGMSGSFRKKGIQDLWHYLHLLDPKWWSSYWRFANQFCYVVDGFWGKEIIGPRNTEALAASIKPYVFTSDSAEKSLPPLNRQPLWVQMDDEQERIYKALEKDRYVRMASNEVVWAKNSLTLFTRHRQLLVCPKMLGGESYGAGLEAIVDKAEDDDNRHFIIWTAFPSALPYIAEYLNQRGYPTIYSLRGGNDDVDVQNAEVGFRTNANSVFTGSIKFAQSFELETSTLQFFLGPDWDVTENEQAEARARRMTTSDVINSLFVAYDGTVDDRVYQVLDNKSINIRDAYKDAQDFEEYWTGRHLGTS